jgi:hypothetical protein
MPGVAWAERQLRAIGDALEKAGQIDAADEVYDIDLKGGDEMGRLAKRLLGKNVVVQHKGEGWSVEVDGEPVSHQLKQQILSDIAFDPDIDAFRSRGRLIGFTEKLTIRTR